ncbi:MAG: hypothetical protein JO165_03195, partial [Candidatus Eremiobacteraeota bacterium]|nr:hypothetical protein [Candidatus Eremiobacteraeota bacterium]
QLLGRAKSSSYLPQSGAAAEALYRELALLFERYERDGYVTLHNATFLLMKDLA